MSYKRRIKLHGFWAGGIQGGTKKGGRTRHMLGTGLEPWPYGLILGTYSYLLVMSLLNIIPTTSPPSHTHSFIAQIFAIHF
jgi:hypothetical protein